MFNPEAAFATFPEVKVLDNYTSKKGTPCVKIGWMNDSGAGEKVFFGEEIARQVSKGGTYAIRANMDGDFFRNFEVKLLAEPVAMAPRARKAA